MSITMFKIQTLNKISAIGLDNFPRDQYEVASEFSSPDAILVRSTKMHDLALPASVKAIGRAGAGVNNIPVDRCTDAGVVVFNTPGANANAVKELVVCSLLLSSRKDRRWYRLGQDAYRQAGKKCQKWSKKVNRILLALKYRGRRSGLLAWAPSACLWRMPLSHWECSVIGFDPYISIDSAWKLSKNVKKAISLDSLLNNQTISACICHWLDNTQEFIDKAKFRVMKKGVRILNFARAGLVNKADLIEAFEQGVVNSFVTDFPDEDLLKHPLVIGIPHLGASTPESESNCAVMAVDQVRNFLEHGNIKNSVNFPEATMDRNGGFRLIIANRNIPKMVGKITSVPGRSGYQHIRYAQ